MSGISIITEFDLKKKNFLDTRQSVADSTARLALSWYFKGLVVRQADNGKRFVYTGDETTNLAGDWTELQSFFTGIGVPAGTLGVIDDIYIDEVSGIFYKKTGTTTWTSQFNTAGASIFTGTLDPPDVLVGVNGDISYVNVGGITKLYRKEGGAWIFKFNVNGTPGTNGDRYATTSVTSINLSTATAPLSLTIGTGLSYTTGQSVEIASVGTPGDKLTSNVVSYNNGTGALVVDSLSITGTGTHTDWAVNLSGAPGKQGKGFLHNEANINLTQAKITTIQGGVYTDVNPWNASVLNDTRSPSELVATLGIMGNMQDHSISWNGTNWFDNGIWRGAKGDKGDKGDQGIQGIQGNPGVNGILPVINLFIDVTGTYNLDFNTSPNPVHYNVYISAGFVTLNLNPMSSIAQSGSIVTIGFSELITFPVTIQTPSGGRLLHRGKKVSSYLFLDKNITGMHIVTQFGGGEQLYKIVGEVSTIISNIVTQKTNVDYSLFQNLSTKTYPTITVDLESLRHSIRVWHNFRAARDSGGSDIIVVDLQRSNAAAPFTFTSLKTITFRLDSTDWSSCEIEFIDGTTNAFGIGIINYRVVVTNISGGNFNISNDNDYVIHLVPCERE